MPLCSNTTNDPVLATIFVCVGTGGPSEPLLTRLRCLVDLSPVGGASSHEKEAVASLASVWCEQVPKTAIISLSPSAMTSPQPSSASVSKTTSSDTDRNQLKK